MLVALALTLNVGNIAAALGTLAGLSAAVGVIARLRPVKWLWRRLVQEPFTEWFRREVGDIVDAKLDARPLLNGKGAEVIEVVQKVAEKLEVD